MPLCIASIWHVFMTIFQTSNCIYHLNSKPYLACIRFWLLATAVCASAFFLFNATDQLKDAFPPIWINFVLAFSFSMDFLANFEFPQWN
jgi:putative effector of murein hydrolase